MSETRAAYATNPLRISERQFQDALVQYAKLLGYHVYHTHDSRRSEPGFPDLVIAGHDRVVFAELKREGGRMTDAQREWQRVLRASGARAYCWYPSSWASIERELAR